MKSWKTTAAGLFVAVVIAIKPVIETGQINWMSVAMAAGMAVIGFVSKDAQVTGGTVPQTDEAQTRVTSSQSAAVK